MNRTVLVDLVRAPFTEAQVVALTRWQRRTDVHPFTCGRDTCRAVLVATAAGWICPACSYTQNWAHTRMCQ